VVAIAGTSDTLKSSNTGRCLGTDHPKSTVLEDRIELIVGQSIHEGKAVDIMPPT
jgi:hypothetical protein